ncbi:cupin [Planomonospora sp. ID67723]|uniref:cupin domain-containing protein n=1 Tax=Planomonospora sp. ID67723 TaxID=2738134 RepID=UPI0018C42BED|nr:cupin [Planomonospora sp. ID67723]MBG0831857.1 cupin [Planomonospora sp. ID67723]
MTLIRSADARRTETPAAVMTTLASPSQGEATLALWRVEMQPAAQGPVHLIDAEQVWALMVGEATITLDGRDLHLGQGDTAILAADATRQVTAGPQGFTAIVTAPAGARAGVPGSTDKVIPPWIA